MKRILNSQEAAILLIIAASVATLIAVAALKNSFTDVPRLRALQSSPERIMVTTPVDAAQDRWPVFANAWQ